PAPAVAMVAAEAAAPPAAAAMPAGGPMAMDDLAAWGLSDDAVASPPAPPAGAPAAFDQDANMFSMDGMLPDAAAGAPVTMSPPLSPVDDWDGFGDGAATLPGDGGPGEGGADREFKRPERKKPKLRAPSLPTVILVLVALLLGLIGWRADVVRVMPQ